ncbi:MAG: hypothetical protein ACRDV2_15495 [Actinomycetes bacterium]
MPGSDSDADSLDYIQRYTQTFYHPGRDLRDRIAVDSERVPGVDGRRSWTSVMPVIVGRSTNAPTITIAEKIISAHRRAACHRGLGHPQHILLEVQAVGLPHLRDAQRQPRGVINQPLIVDSPAGRLWGDRRPVVGHR